MKNFCVIKDCEGFVLGFFGRYLLNQCSAFAFQWRGCDFEIEQTFVEEG